MQLCSSLPELGTNLVAASASESDFDTRDSSAVGSEAYGIHFFIDLASNLELKFEQTRLHHA